MIKKKHSFKKVVTKILITILAFTFVTLNYWTVYAKERYPNVQEELTITELEKKFERMRTIQIRMKKAVAVLEPYVNRNCDGTFIIELNDPRQLNINTVDLDNLKKGITLMNSLVREGILETDNDLNVRFSKEIFTKNMRPNLSDYFGSPLELMIINFYWWGIEVRLNNEACTLLQLSLGAGGVLWGISSLLCTFFPEPTLITKFIAVISTVAGIIYGMGSIGLTLANTYNCGICIHLSWLLQHCGIVAIKC